MRSLNLSAASTALTSPLGLKLMTMRQTAFGIDGEPRGTYLTLTDEAARDFVEYRSMLKRLSSKSSGGLDDHAHWKKSPMRGVDSAIGARRPCRVISL